DAGIRLDRLGADDLDAVKEAAQTRLGELALLVEEITLGDEHKPVAPCERLEGVGHMWQGFDRMPHEVAADLHDPAQDLAWNPALRHLDCCFHHREHEALNAEAVEFEIAHRRLKQALRQMLRVGMICYKCGEALFCQ